LEGDVDIGEEIEVIIVEPVGPILPPDPSPDPIPVPDQPATVPA